MGKEYSRDGLLRDSKNNTSSVNNGGGMVI